MRITPEGQITIAAEIRQRLGLLPDTEVEFEVTEDGLYLRSRSRRRAEGGISSTEMRRRLGLSEV